MTKRNLYLNNLSVEEALEKYLAVLRPLLCPVPESVPVTEALGRTTIAPVFARRSSPLYDSAAMDGVAVISAHTRDARETRPVRLLRGKDFVVVDTGDPIRQPYDAVIMAEDILEIDADTVEIREAAAPWQHVRPIGEDIVQGEMILPGGHKIRPIDIGVLLSGGITRIDAYTRPSVAIFPTGTELIEPDREPVEGEIIESNSRMFEAQVALEGGRPVRFAPVPDNYDILKEEIRKAVREFDMVLVNAGSSAGTEDYTVHILSELGEVVVHGVAMKPGKPVILAVVDGKPVIGVPGYPVSAYLAYQNFAAPVLALLSGSRAERNPVVRAAITRRLVSSLKYREYVRVKVGRVGERLVATPLARGAGAAMSLVRADGFCIIDQDTEGVESGSEVEIELYRSLSELDGMVVSIGSHDMMMDMIADLMSGKCDGMSLSSTHVGSMGGLMALKNGEAHIAPIHLLDEAAGVYNIPAICKIFKGGQMALIKGVGRVQGIMVQRGNPLGIRSVEDLPRFRYVNRQRGAGTRVLLDYLLAKAGISPDDIEGYGREAATHMAVAAAVKNGSADAGLGIFSAANAMDLDFIPVGDEEYDFAIPREFLSLPHIKAFIEVLKSSALHEKLAGLGGYTFGRCGEVVLIDG